MSTRPSSRRLLGAALASLLAAPLGAQTTRMVPEQYPAIQGAIDASTSGDQVSVAPGRYLGQIDFRGKAIALRSRAGATSTILDSLRMGSVVRFAGGEGPGAILEGFTVTGGSARYGGGLFISGSSPTIRSCIIRSNHGFEGGGVYFLNSRATLAGCFLFDNWAFHSGGLGGLGAALYCENSDVALNHLSVSRNSADFIADGLFIASSNPVLTNCIFHTGADLHVSASSAPVLNHCVLDGLWAGAGSGNLWVDPLFADSGFWNPHEPDLHLRYDSPCRDAGLVLATAAEIDGDLRDASPDIGADEFLLASHWYGGDASSGGTLRFRASGAPGDQVFWLIAGNILPSPLPTSFGDLYLDPSLLFFAMGALDGSGVLRYVTPIPWLTPTSFYSQVLVGTTALRLSGLRQNFIGGS